MILCSGVADITTPIFIQYGDYNTGDTFLLNEIKGIK